MYCLRLDTNAMDLTAQTKVVMNVPFSRQVTTLQRNIQHCEARLKTVCTHMKWGFSSSLKQYQRRASSVTFLMDVWKSLEYVLTTPL
jgi:hypothetical protein